MNTKHPIPINKEQLIEMSVKGPKSKFLLFWGHRVPADGSITKSCFSQWYPASFEVDAIHYPTAEHFMMAEKARIFDDSETLEKILQAKSPAQAKKFGRMVKNYDEQTWRKNRFLAVVQGNVAKFSQNTELKEFLLNTKNRILVEASPRDLIWGIGLAADHQHAENPHQWRGQNLLGFALMAAREQIQN